jgi:hypothetical protein
MTFTRRFESACSLQKNKSDRSKVYPYAVDLDAVELVRLIINAGMDVDAYVSATRIGLGKVDTNGVPYVVLYCGRRIRLSTLRRLHRVETQRQRDEARAAQVMTSRPASIIPRAGGLLAQLDETINCTNKPPGRFL